MKKVLALILCLMLSLSLLPCGMAEGATAATEGVGVSFTFRQTGAGSSTYNTTVAFVSFDADGKIVNAYVDVVEMGDPTTSMASCPRYAIVGETMDWCDQATGEIAPQEVTAEMAQEMVSTWRTKRQRGTEYGMTGAGDWFQQMDAYQEFFKGKTVAELKDWEANGLDEKGKPVDAVSGATMSVNDGHSNILAAIYDAWENKTDYVACDKEGYGFTFTFRQTGSGSSTYNTAFSRVKLAADGTIIGNYEDVLEMSDPTTSMASCPRYAVVGDTENWYDLTTGETVSKEITAEMAQELVSTWRTKRQRGTEYGMTGAGDWFQQMDAYQTFFNGKTAEELNAWGQEGLDEKGKPVDAITGATMSINDGHSDILGAVIAACTDAMSK